MFHFEAFMHVVIFVVFEVSGWASMRVTVYVYMLRTRLYKRRIFTGWWLVSWRPSRDPYTVFSGWR
jgi:hypothetical protein